MNGGGPTGGGGAEESPDDNAVLRSTARSTVLSFAGALISGLSGFVLAIILGRTVGPAGNGIVFQLISVFMIASAVAKLGLDTTCVWLLPRLAVDRRSDIRRATALLLWGSLAGGLLAGSTVFFLAPILSSGQPELLILLHAAGLFMPVASLGTVALAVTRGLGGIRPYVLIGSIGLPSTRLAAIAVAMAFAASAVLAGFIWLAVLLLAAVAALLAVRSRLRPLPRTSNMSASRSALTRRISRYSGPRLASSVLEQAILWQDVIIVGFIAGPAAAGVYGVVSRLAQAGFIPSTSMRIVVAPQFSRMIHENRVAELAGFYMRTTQWIALMSAPIYVIFFVLAEPVLGIFGPGFQEGTLALMIVSCGALVWTSAGNVQSLLLMSGRSGWAAINKLAVVILSLTMLVILVPVAGIVGAAIAWSVSMTCDVVLAVLLARRAVGIRLHLRGTLLAIVCAVTATAIPTVSARLIFGPSLTALLVGVIAAVVLYGGVLYVLKERFALHHASAMFSRRKKTDP